MERFLIIKVWIIVSDHATRRHPPVLPPGAGSPSTAARHRGRGRRRAADPRVPQTSRRRKSCRPCRQRCASRCGSQGSAAEAGMGRCVPGSSPGYSGQCECAVFEFFPSNDSSVLDVPAGSAPTSSMFSDWNASPCWFCSAAARLCAPCFSRRAMRPESASGSSGLDEPRMASSRPEERDGRNKEREVKIWGQHVSMSAGRIAASSAFCRPS